LRRTLRRFHATERNVAGFLTLARGCSFWIRSLLTRRKPPRKLFAAWKTLGDRIAELERDEQDRLRLLDLWSFSGGGRSTKLG